MSGSGYDKRITWKADHSVCHSINAGKYLSAALYYGRYYCGRTGGKSPGAAHWALLNGSPGWFLVSLLAPHRDFLF